MATTTTTITLSSDIADNNLRISNTATLTKAGNDTGVAATTGLTRVELASSSAVTLFDMGETTRLNAIVSGKLFIQNLNDRGDGTKYVTLLVHAVEVGRLYGGDFAFCPFNGGAGNDIILDPSDATATTMEYIMFYE